MYAQADVVERGNDSAYHRYLRSFTRNRGDTTSIRTRQRENTWKERGRSGKKEKRRVNNNK
jgi:hypothetical protein